MVSGTREPKPTYAPITIDESEQLQVEEKINEESTDSNETQHQAALKNELLERILNILSDSGNKDSDAVASLLSAFEENVLKLCVIH